MVVRKTFILNLRKGFFFLPWSMDPKKREQDPEFLGQPHSFMSPHFIHRDSAKYLVSSWCCDFKSPCNGLLWRTGPCVIQRDSAFSS